MYRNGFDGVGEAVTIGVGIVVPVGVGVVVPTIVGVAPGCYDFRQQRQQNKPARWTHLTVGIQV